MIEVARFRCRSEVADDETLTAKPVQELGVVVLDIEDGTGQPLADTNIHITPTDARRLSTLLLVMASDLEGYGR